MFLKTGTNVDINNTITTAKAHFDELWRSSQGGEAPECLFNPTAIEKEKIAVVVPIKDLRGQTVRGRKKDIPAVASSIVGGTSSATSRVVVGVPLRGKMAGTTLTTEEPSLPLVSSPSVSSIFKEGRDLEKVTSPPLPSIASADRTPALPAGFSPPLTRDQRKESGRPLGSPAGVRGPKVRQQTGRTVGV